MLNKTIGNTPMIKIKYEYNKEIKYIYAKLEYYNLTGSIKDRVAYYIINNAKKRNELKDGQPIIEATSGNTGIAIAALGALYNHPTHIFMPDNVSIERVKIMKSYGANVYLIPKNDGGFIKSLEEANKLAKKINGYLANQFANEDNFAAHYETTGQEILNEIKEPLSGFVSGVGTGGTLMGIGTRLKEKYPNLLITAIEPHLMPLLSGGKILSEHKIEGIGDDFIPALIDQNKIDKIIPINDDDAVNIARLLAKTLGLGVGISSGANFIGSVLLNQNVDNSVVTIFADDNKKYLSTDLSKNIDLNKKFISNNIKLISYEVI